MNRLRLRVTSEEPPDSHRYVHPEDGHTTRARDRQAWFAAILKHKKDNGYDVPADWKEIAEDQLARLLPAGWGFFENGSAPEHFVNTRITVADVKHGTSVLKAFIWEGMPTVPLPQIEARALTCARCYFNIPIPGCQPCNGMADLIVSIAGNIVTASDHHLKSCAVCKCSNQAQTRLPIEILAKGVTPEMMPLWPSACWKRQELEAIGL